MDKQLDDMLCARWPAIFRDRHVDPAISCMGRGFECGNGWFWLVDQACAALQAEADRGDAQQPVAAQVKEKFGSLRIQLVKAGPSQRAVLDFLYGLSTVTSETCGQLGMQCIHAGAHLAQVQGQAWDTRFKSTK